MKFYQTKDGRSYLLPFVLVTSLFFLWGFAHNILDVLNKHFQETFEMTKAHSAWVQAAVYGGYFLMALPAGRIITRWGYRSGVLTGLLLYGVGALLFNFGPTMATGEGQFRFFVLCLFVIGCGLTCLETSSNPYVTVLGHPDAAARRINIAQSFNGLGAIVGPSVGGLMILSAGDITSTYTVLGIVVLAVAVLFAFVPLPEVGAGAAESSAADAAAQPASSGVSLWRTPSFTLGLVALFVYVAAQTGVNSFFINYMEDRAALRPAVAAQWQAYGGMGLFLVGRVVGSWAMAYVRAERLLAWFAAAATVAAAFLLFTAGWVGMAAFFVVYFCESIMFPTIFAMALRHVGRYTKQASSYLIMTIVGGAVAPLLMGWIADTSGSIALGFVVPLVCYVIILCYALRFASARSIS